ncbi:MAG: hypothetical protein E7175_00290 [Erysipelotrichaceae bacterium]|nr:hypothetical protein [Erysipelotrichaceae bacterium]
MQVFGVWGDITNFSVLDSLIVALVAILLVFLVLTIIILVTSGIQKGMEAVEARTKILPKKENEILDEDPDAAVAALVAVIDFHKETGKDAEIISIKKVED